MTTADKQKENSLNSLTMLYKSCGLSLKSITDNSKQWTVKEEVCHYLSTLNQNHTFAEYWKNNKTRLPILSSIALRYNIICPTSISSESAFSISGFIQRKNRSSLTPETLRYSMLLRQQDKE